jgi:diguanylate cyclase (GGDEF)-like protein/PAS domain S-box-containing protein
MINSKPSVQKSSIPLIFSGFSIMILLLLLFAYITLNDHKEDAQLIENMYQHPFTVSVAVLKADNDIISMHRYMKDVVLATSPAELETAIALVEQHEHSVYQHFKLIKQRFLGDKETINLAYKTFVDWKPIRNEVVDLKRNNKDRLAAAITTGKEAMHVKLLSQNMQILIDFAHYKANDYRDTSKRTHDKIQTHLYSLVILTVFFAGITTLFVILLVRRAEHSRNQSQERFEALYNNSEISIWSEDFSLVYIELEKFRLQGITNLKEHLQANQHLAWDLAAMVKVNTVNNATLKLFEAKSETDFIKKMDRTFGADAIEIFINELVAIWTQQEIFSSEANYLSLAGKEIKALISFVIPTKINDYKNIPINIVDITQQKKNEKKLELSARVFSDTHEGIIITDIDGTIIDANPAFSKITGYSREEVIGQNPKILNSGKQKSEFYKAMWQQIEELGYWQGEIWNRKKDGDFYAELLTISSLKDTDDRVINYVSLSTDITHSKIQQEQMHQMAHYDALTHLPNRSLLADRLSHAMAQCQRHNQILVVVFIDLDGFKLVNDTYGHSVGDELLIEISMRLKEVLRNEDTLSRIGGDEFVAVLTGLAKVEDCLPVLERFLHETASPITIGGTDLNVSASIGATIYPQDGGDADLLMRHADQAMYIAKNSGKNRYHLFDTKQDNAIKDLQQKIADIRSAFKNNEFVLYYQPKVNMLTGKVIGVEALIRHQHPTLGILPPSEFLPVIENQKISLEIGEWVIATALSQISAWQAQGLDFLMSVNVPAYQLQQDNFVTRLGELLAVNPEVNPNRLELEVLETSALEDISHISEIMKSCINLGVSFALDDFGTGYSSLTYLRRLPTELIKIDQSFVRDMLQDPDDLNIVKGVIALANSFEREVIAEGVETIEHGSELLKLGCKLAQGYGVSKPMPAAEVYDWVNNWMPDPSWKLK